MEMLRWKSNPIQPSSGNYLFFWSASSWLYVPSNCAKHIANCLHFPIWPFSVERINLHLSSCCPGNTSLLLVSLYSMALSSKVPQSMITKTPNVTEYNIPSHLLPPLKQSWCNNPIYFYSWNPLCNKVVPCCLLEIIGLASLLSDQLSHRYLSWSYSVSRLCEVTAAHDLPIGFGLCPFLGHH